MIPNLPNKNEIYVSTDLPKQLPSVDVDIYKQLRTASSADYAPTERGKRSKKGYVAQPTRKRELGVFAGTAPCIEYISPRGHLITLRKHYPILTQVPGGTTQPGKIVFKNKFNYCMPAAKRSSSSNRNEVML